MLFGRSIHRMGSLGDPGKCGYVEAKALPDGETVGGICMWAVEGDGETPEAPPGPQILKTSVSWDSNPGLKVFYLLVCFSVRACCLCPGHGGHQKSLWPFLHLFIPPI